MCCWLKNKLGAHGVCVICAMNALNSNSNSTSSICPKHFKDILSLRVYVCVCVIRNGVSVYQAQGGKGGVGQEQGKGGRQSGASCNLST